MIFVLLISTERPFDPRSTVTRSGRRSPLKSPATRPAGLVPTPKNAAGKVRTTIDGSASSAIAINAPPAFSRTETVFAPVLATATSTRPSLLKSPSVRDDGLPITVKLNAAWKPPLPFPSNIETLPELELAVPMSANPSPFMSPTVTAIGLLPTGKSPSGENVPSPLPRNTLTLLVLELAVTRSGTPSPLNSPVLRADIEAAVVKLLGAWKVPLPLPKRTVTVPGVAPDAEATKS